MDMLVEGRGAAPGPPDVEDCAMGGGGLPHRPLSRGAAAVRVGGGMVTGRGTPFQSPRSLSQEQRSGLAAGGRGADAKRRLAIGPADVDIPGVLPRAAPVRNKRFDKEKAKKESPTYPFCSPKGLPSGPEPLQLAFDRFYVLAAADDAATLTKVLVVTEFRLEFKENPPGSASRLKTGHVVLRGDWFWSPVKEGDVFNVVSPSCKFCTDIAAAESGIYFDTDPSPLSDDDDLLFVLHPDTIISPSYISDQLACQRRAVLKHR